MRLIFMLAIFSLLTACGTLTPSPSTNTLLNREKRLEKLNHFWHWQLKGSVGVQTADKGWSASLFWEQNNMDYHLSLFGPLGVNRIELVGNQKQATLLTNSASPLTAKDPATLLQQNLGWHLPVNYLKYWVKGTAAPTKITKQKQDYFGHLSQLYQDTWEVNYFNYSNINGLDLPTKIVVSNPQIKVKLIIYQWKL